MLGLFYNKFHMITGFVANGADDCFSIISGIVVYTYDTTVLFAVEQTGLGPTYEERNMFFQKSLLNFLLALRIKNFT